MEHYKLRKVDIAPLLGGKNRVSEVLSGKIGLSMMMIKNLHNKLGMSYESLIKNEFHGSEEDEILIDVVIKNKGPHRKKINRGSA